MHISGEGKLGLGLALMLGVGTGAALLWPDHRIIGWVIMAGSAIGLSALAIYHFIELWRERSSPGGLRVALAFAGIVILGLGAAVCAGLYFWPASKPQQEAQAPHRPARMVLDEPVPTPRPDQNGPEKQEKKSRIFRRLIAYENIAPEFSPSPQGGFFISGFQLSVRNVSDDTIETHVETLGVGVNDEKPLSLGPQKATILPQTQMMPWHFGFQAPPLGDAATVVMIDFEVDYDTIPATGLRRSYKKIAFALNWANGRNNPPLTTANITDQWER